MNALLGKSAVQPMMRLNFCKERGKENTWLGHFMSRLSTYCPEKGNFCDSLIDADLPVILLYTT